MIPLFTGTLLLFIQVHCVIRIHFYGFSILVDIDSFLYRSLDVDFTLNYGGYAERRFHWML
jgi:hypothetical protein